jgi:hypothetical protein
VEIGLLGGNGWQSAGNVTIPPSHSVPKMGDVVEVRFLYAFPGTGTVYQPVYLGLRADGESFLLVRGPCSFGYRASGSHLSSPRLAAA